MVEWRAMDAHESRIVAFLSDPKSYPHPAGAVQKRQTHVSHVFLAGEFAYKLKKPVKFPFLDASTLSLREKFCRLELTLNRRLAPEIYLGMVPITQTPQGLQLGAKGQVMEWVVKMRRLPDALMLDRCVARRKVSRRDMQPLAKRLMPFFARARRGDAIRAYGKPDAVRALVLGNLNECGPFVGPLLSEADRTFVEQAYRQFLALQEPLLARRAKEGRIIDGHGDLRCENICMTQPVNVFDCVEFEPAFRCGDMANDLAFLLMDLEFRGRADLSEALWRAYPRALSDPTAERVLAFYKCHRTLVRGKVRAFAWQQHPESAQGRKAKQLSRRHFRLARTYAAQFAKPRLIVVCGLIGSGKSTLARQLAQAFGADWLRTDEIRLTEFAKFRKPGQDFEGGLYAPAVSAKVYRRLMQRAAASIKQGRSVVCDGLFSKALGRQALRELAAKHGASFHLFECTVPRQVALLRIAARARAKSDISEAKPGHYDRLAAEFEPIRLNGSVWTRLSDNRAPSATFRAALGVLRRLWAQ